jgi:YfiH family protein
MDPFVLEQKPGQPSVLRLASWMDKFDGLTVGFTSRLGGVSEPPLGPLNSAFHVGDREADVVENRCRITKLVGFDLEAWTCAEQVHDCQVTIVESSDRGAGSKSRETAIPNTDALVTNHKDIMLTSFYADCVPLFFIDPLQRVVGLAHAGWKGTALQIATKTIDKMSKVYGSKPSNMLAAIGPSIGACCYEVDQQVVNQIGAPTPARKDNGRYMLDLKEINRQFMIRAGILPNHIEVTSLCTSCSTDLFFSHRAENGRTGRMASWIGWLKRGE